MIVMLLILMMIFLSIAAYFFRFSVIEFVKPTASFLHQLCLSTVPDLLQHKESAQALICGKNFSSAEQSSLWVSSGLIHLFVVSGTHLNFISLNLNRLQVPVFISTTLLFLYCLVCQMNAPVVRSFLFITLTLVLKKNILYWPKDRTLLIASLFCTILNPEWITSLSFLMSWLAALILMIQTQNNSDDSALNGQILFYLGFSFCFSQFGFPTGAIVLFAVLLAPFLEKILFPLALSLILIPVLCPLFDGLINAIQKIIVLLELNKQLPQQNQLNLLLMNGVIILSIHIYLFYFPTESNNKPRAAL